MGRRRIFELCGGLRRDAKGSRSPGCAGLRPSGGRRREAPRGRGPLPLRGRGPPPTPLRPVRLAPRENCIQISSQWLVC